MRIIHVPCPQSGARALFWRNVMKQRLRAALAYFTLFEKILYLSSVVFITAAYLLFDSGSALSLIASLVGATALIFCAKGNPIGQLLMVVFGILYAIISYSYAYYGELITYAGMSVPMAAFSFLVWVFHPHRGNHAEVQVGHLLPRDAVILPLLAVAATVGFYFILDAFGTANILPSTLSVTTSVIAVYFSARRVPWFALAYAINDVVLIVLWTLAAFQDISYLSVVICFVMFLFNDTYSFTNWRRIKRRQA